MTSTIKSLFALLACTLLWQSHVLAADDYRLDYLLDLSESPKSAKVSLTVRQSRSLLRLVRFTVDSDKFRYFESEEGLSREGDVYVWKVPAKGGQLTWRAMITNERKSGQVDSKLTKNWALFRGEDVFPAMASIAVKGSASMAALFVDLPSKWSFHTAYLKQGGGFRVENPSRRFDRPTGWMVAGDIGVRLDRIADIRVKIAGPKGDDIRRQDMLALLNWTIPEFAQLFPSFPKNVLIVSAGDPFWRGGLSGPASLYIHADRPLISENGTSTLLHELFHVAFLRRAQKGNDWIVEGLAEYYSVEMLRRTGTVTASRNQKTLRSLEKWGSKSKSLVKRRSSGATTARAVGVFAALDKEIATRTKKKKNLDDIVRLLTNDKQPLTLKRVSELVEQVCGRPSEVLSEIK